MPPIDLSIVIPAYGSERALDTTLRALASSEPGPITFEVIVVDDGSEQSLERIVDAHHAIPARFVRLPKNSGRSSARNAGAARAHGKRLLFLDCDSIPLRGLVQGHAAVATDDQASGIILGARINPGWEVLKNSLSYSDTSKSVAPHENDHRQVYGVARLANKNISNQRAPWVYCHSHNLSLPRDAFMNLGGFDENFVEWGWEDVELGYRYFLSQHRDGGFEYRPDIVCMHLPHFHGSWMSGIKSTNFRYLKRKHLYFDTELLGTALEPDLDSKIRYYEGILPGIRHAGLGIGAAEVRRVLPETEKQNALWIGCRLGNDEVDGWQFDHGRDAAGHNAHLLGVDTPFGDREFEAVVNVDLWRFLTPQDLSLSIAESLRISDCLLLFASVDLRYHEGALRMEDLDYFVEAFESNNRILKVQAVPGGTVIRVTAP
jgi:glycosyltransferase involved in cell wall biosynthesis